MCDSHAQQQVEQAEVIHRIPICILKTADIWENKVQHLATSTAPKNSISTLKHGGGSLSFLAFQ